MLSNTSLKKINFTIQKNRFLVVGFLNTFFGYGIYAFMILIDLKYKNALLVANVCGMIFNYFNFKIFVFDTRQGILTFFKFMLVYIVIYEINSFNLRFFTQEVSLNYYLGQVFCVPLNILVSWLLMNYWVFKE